MGKKTKKIEEPRKPQGKGVVNGDKYPQGDSNTELGDPCKNDFDVGHQ